MAFKIKNLGTKFSMRIEEDGLGAISTNGGVFVIDPISSYILINLNEKKSMAKIIYSLLKRYNVTYGVLIEDIKKLAKQLYDFKFISLECYKHIMKEIKEDEENK